MRKSKLNQFHIRLLIVQGLLIMLALLFFSLVVTIKFTTELKADAFERITMQRTALQNQVELNLGRVESVIGQLAFGDVMDSLSRDTFDAKAQYAIQELPIITQIYIMDKTGMQIYKSSFVETEGDRSDRDYFKAAIKGESYFSSVIVSRSTNIPIVVYAKPIYKDGKINGVMGASIDLTFLSRLVAPGEAAYNPDASYGFIVDSQGKVIGHPNSTFVSEMKDLSDLAPIQLATQMKTGTGEYKFEGLDKLASFGYMEKSKWGIFYQTPLQIAYVHVNMIKEVMGLTFVVITCISVLLAVGVSRYFKRPVAEILELIRNFENYRACPKQCSMRTDEFGIISDAFVDMAQTVLADQLELEARIAERTSELNLAQEQIVQSEKMAALGRMTNNFAHEVNTPLGTAITVTDFLERTIENLVQHTSKENHSPKEVAEHLHDLTEMAELIKRQLNTVNGLFESLFKSDFISSRYSGKEEVSLSSYLNLQVIDMQALLNDSQHELSFNCDLDENVRIPYKEKLIQVLKLLIQNSLQHGFEVMTSGKININLTQDDERVILSYSDNGKNLTEDQISRIFEPYYKGDMAAEGKGLGLTIVYTLVVHFMNGKITCHNLSPSGLEYVIEIPYTNNLAKGGVIS